MKITVCILLVLLWKLSFSQDTCLPRYGLPVKFTTSGAKLAYVEKGKGKTVLFIHGLGGNLSHWLKVMQLLPGYKSIGVDLPGYGYSSKTQTNGKDQLQFYADAIVSLIKEKKLKKIILVGHSMGGQVATIVAAQHPEKVSRLILVAPAGLETFTAAEAKLLVNATPPSYFEKQDEKTIRASYNLNFFSQPEDAEQLIGYRLRMRECPAFISYTQNVSDGVKGMLAHPVINDFAKIKFPVLLIFGNEDALIPNKYLHPALRMDSLVAQLKLYVPQLQYKSINNAGHLVQFEKPVDVADKIKKFIQ